MNIKRYYGGFLLLAMGCGEQAHINRDHQEGVAEDRGYEEGALANPSNNDALGGNVEFRPENFVKGVSNPYFNLVPGRRWYFEGQSPLGVKIKRDVIGSGSTKEIQGVTAQGVWEREWRDDTLTSETKKWYAQDRNGNVWWLGQDESEIFGGYQKSRGDSWQAGDNNAKAVVLIPGQIEKGSFGVADKRGEILSVGESVKVPRGDLKDCIKTRDLDPSVNSEEHQYYCKETGNLSLEIVPNSFGKVELTRVEDNYPTAGMNHSYPVLRADISEEQAKRTALKEIEGAESVASVSIALWDKKPAYLVEVVKEDKKSASVYLDIHKGFVLKTFE